MATVYRTISDTSLPRFFEALNSYTSGNYRIRWIGYHRGFLKTTYKAVVSLGLAPSKPGATKLHTTAEVRDMLKFVIVLPEKTAEEFDVVSRQVTIAINGVVAATLTAAATDTEVGPFAGRDNDQIDVSVVNVDDAGNVSAVASTLSTVLTDTFAPPAPGALAVLCVGEEPDPLPEEPVVEEPVVEEPVVEEPVVEEPIVG